jgi:hypothetical protein
MRWKPARSYHHGQVGGRLAFALLCWCDSYTDIEKLRETGNAITREEIGEWFAGHSSTLTAEDVESLYKNLNVIRVTGHAKDVLPPDYPFKRAQEGLTLLEAALPNAMTDIQSFMTGNVLGDMRRRESLREIERFSRAIERIRRHIGNDLPPINHKYAAWHDDAMFIAKEAKDIMERDGRTVAINSANSALARLSLAILQRVTPDEHTRRSTDAVRQAIAKHPQRGLLASNRDAAC